MGRFWLRNIYLASLGEDEGNWKRCFAANRWITDRNRDCRQRYWPGCSPGDGAAGAHERTSEDAGWCLVADPVVRQPGERSRL